MIRIDLLQPCIALLMALLLAGCVALEVQAPPTTTNPGPAPMTSPTTGTATNAITGTVTNTVTNTVSIPEPAIPVSIHQPLAAALAYAPATVDFFSFTDWSYIKAEAGHPEITSQHSIDERMDFILPISIREQALGSFYANSNFRTHAENWGWDATDLLWESSLTTSGPPLYVLRFRDDFDFAPVLARLDERGYSVHEHGGVTLYSHEMDLSSGWLTTSEFAILNIAHLPEEKIFILSSSPDNVTATLDAIAAGSTLDTSPAVAAVAAQLGASGAVILSSQGCQPLDVGIMLRGSPEGVKAHLEEMQQWGIDGLYTVFGLGYRMEEINGERMPLGIFVYHYPLASQAHADLEPRRMVAQNALSLTREVPYSELFEVVDAKVVEIGPAAANLVLALHAIERPPQIFFQMVYSRDTLFSICGLPQ